jgi:L-malate glycosyltransferase
MKNICVLTQIYPDFSDSARGRIMKPLYKEIARKGYGVNIVTPRVYEKSKRKESFGPIRVNRFSYFSGGRLLDSCDKIPVLRMIFYFISGLWTTTRVVLSRRCELIHVHFVIPTGIIAVLAGVLTRRKVIVTVYGTEINWFMWNPSRTIGTLIKLVLNKADVITAISEYAKTAAGRYISAGKDVVVTGVGGIDYLKIGEVPGRSSARIELGLKEEEYIILFIGGLTRRKRVTDLLDAFARIRGDIQNPRLIIIGKGEERDRLGKMAEERHLTDSVTFIDRVPVVMPYYAAADMFVLPSEEEGLGVVTMEAMAYGCPVLATRTSGSLNLIREDVDGFLCEVGDPEGLARKIKFLYDNPAMTKTAAGLAREKARMEFSLESQVDKFVRVYESC